MYSHWTCSHVIVTMILLTGMWISCTLGRQEEACMRFFLRSSKNVGQGYGAGLVMGVGYGAGLVMGGCAMF